MIVIRIAITPSLNASNRVVFIAPHLRLAVVTVEQFTAIIIAPG
jgi:hypothetical protein